MDKKEALKKVNILEKELLQLKEIINKPKDLFDTIKTYSDVCKELGEKELTISNFPKIEKQLAIKLLNIAKINQIAKLFNGEWVIDWNNNNQYKYYPFFDFSDGFRFCASHSRYSTFSGMVAYFKDEKTSTFVGKTFIDLYKNIQ